MVELALDGVLDGFPDGEIRRVTGTAKGAVVVRDPTLGVTINHPETVRVDEQYPLRLTISNTGNAPVNLLTLSLPISGLSGTEVVGESSKTIPTLPPGESELVEFQMVSHRTGRVVASSIRHGSQIDPRFEFSVGVGELGIPLSPEAIILPDSTGSLPEDLVRHSLALVGLGYSLGTAPVESLGPDLPQIDLGSLHEKVYWLGPGGPAGDPRRDPVRRLGGAGRGVGRRPEPGLGLGRAPATDRQGRPGGAGPGRRLRGGSPRDEPGGGVRPVRRLDRLPGADRGRPRGRRRDEPVDREPDERQGRLRFRPRRRPAARPAVRRPLRPERLADGAPGVAGNGRLPRHPRGRRRRLVGAPPADPRAVGGAPEDRLDRTLPRRRRLRVGRVPGVGHAVHPVGRCRRRRGRRRPGPGNRDDGDAPPLRGHLRGPGRHDDLGPRCRGAVHPGRGPPDAAADRSGPVHDPRSGLERRAGAGRGVPVRRRPARRLQRRSGSARERRNRLPAGPPGRQQPVRWAVQHPGRAGDVRQPGEPVQAARDDHPGRHRPDWGDGDQRRRAGADDGHRSGRHRPGDGLRPGRPGRAPRPGGIAPGGRDLRRLSDRQVRRGRDRFRRAFRIRLRAPDELLGPLHPPGDRPGQRLPRHVARADPLRRPDGPARRADARPGDGAWARHLRRRHGAGDVPGHRLQPGLLRRDRGDLRPGRDVRDPRPAGRNDQPGGDRPPGRLRVPDRRDRAGGRGGGAQPDDHPQGARGADGRRARYGLRHRRDDPRLRRLRRPLRRRRALGRRAERPGRHLRLRHGAGGARRDRGLRRLDGSVGGSALFRHPARPGQRHHGSSPRRPGRGRGARLPPDARFGDADRGRRRLGQRDALQHRHRCHRLLPVGRGVLRQPADPGGRPRAAGPGLGGRDRLLGRLGGHPRPLLRREPGQRDHRRGAGLFRQSGPRRHDPPRRRPRRVVEGGVHRRLRALHPPEHVTRRLQAPRVLRVGRRGGNRLDPLRGGDALRPRPLQERNDPGNHPGDQRVRPGGRGQVPGHLQDHRAAVDRNRRPRLRGAHARDERRRDLRDPGRARRPLSGHRLECLPRREDLQRRDRLQRGGAPARRPVPAERRGPRNRAGLGRPDAGGGGDRQPAAWQLRGVRPGDRRGRPLHLLPDPPGRGTVRDRRRDRAGRGLPDGADLGGADQGGAGARRGDRPAAAGDSQRLGGGRERSHCAGSRGHAQGGRLPIPPTDPQHGRGRQLQLHQHLRRVGLDLGSGSRARRPRRARCGGDRRGGARGFQRGRAPGHRRGDRAGVLARDRGAGADGASRSRPWRQKQLRQRHDHGRGVPVPIAALRLLPGPRLRSDHRPVRPERLVLSRRQWAGGGRPSHA